MPSTRSDSQVSPAAAALRAGGAVVLPTETVYGLAADAANPHAVARIYALKGRPADHPLIVHVASAADVDRWVRDVPSYARRVATEGWPGPLTLVLRRSGAIGEWVTGGQDTVAIRVPDHPLAQAILRAFGSAVASPSANRFGRVSPTSAEHVRADIGALLDPARDVIVDGGECVVGVESTIVDCTGSAPAVLRPGRVSAQQVAKWAGVPVAESPPTRPRVSGSLTSHYAPTASVSLVTQHGIPPDFGATPSVGLIAIEEVATPPGVVRLMAPRDTAAYARGLYAALREADALQLARVVAVPPTGDDGLAHAIRDRLMRAAASR